MSCLSRSLPVLLLALVPWVQAAAAVPAPTALQCGQVFDARRGALMPAHTIVVREGKVAELRAGHEPVAGATLVDLRAHTCTPGWTDLHVHLASQSSPQSYSEGFRLSDADYAFRAAHYARKTLLAGFTSVRDLGGEVAPHLRDAINQGLIEGPRIRAAVRRR